MNNKTLMKAIRSQWCLEWAKTDGFKHEMCHICTEVGSTTDTEC